MIQGLSPLPLLDRGQAKDEPDPRSPSELATDQVGPLALAMSAFTELKRRHVFRAGADWQVAGWRLQVASRTSSFRFRDEDQDIQANAAVHRGVRPL